MERILGIDPGQYASAYCLLIDGQPSGAAKVPNESLRGKMLCELDPEVTVVIETIFPRGQAVGLDTMETQFWAGRFAECAAIKGRPFHKIDRQDVRYQICGSLQTGDSNVRQALIDHYGGDGAARKGERCPYCNGKKCVGRGRARVRCVRCEGSGWLHQPGPLKGYAKDMWAALAIALAWRLKQQLKASA